VATTVTVYNGIDPVTGRQPQIKGSRYQAEPEADPAQAEVLAARHRGTAPKPWARINPRTGKVPLPQVDPPAAGSLLHALRKGGSLRWPGSRCRGAGCGMCMR
jgi:hypothetical protein